MNKYILALSLFLILPACAGPISYSQVKPLIPGPEEAVINFYHPFSLEDSPIWALARAPRFTFQIWEDEEFVGFLFGIRCLQVRAKPGKNIFLGRVVDSNAGNWTVLQGDIEAGKIYFVKVYQRMNTWKPSISLEVLRPTDPEFNNIDACKAPVAYDRTASTDAEFWDNHVKENIDVVRTVLGKVKAGSKDYYFDPDIEPADGR